MTKRNPTSARKLLLPTILLALVSVASCVNRADLPKLTGVLSATPEPTPAAQIATLPTLLPGATLAPLPAPASEASIEEDSTVEPAAFSPNLDGLSPKVLRTALDAVSCARSRGISGRRDRLTVIDYSRPSTEPRLWVLDLKQGKVLFHELVAHGAGSGDNYATQFSNTLDSRQTSLGLFLTESTYEGGNGYSLRLRGLDPGVNDLAEERNIVMHGAWYVSAQHAREHGRLGRSWGCPALPLEEARPVIDAVKGGSFVFAYAETRGALREATFASSPTSSSGKCEAGNRPAAVRPARPTVVEAKAAALASIVEPATAQP
jgi:hypothetical protein